MCCRGLELLRLWRSAFPEARVVVGSYARWLVMRRKQKWAVFARGAFVASAIS